MDNETIVLTAMVSDILEAQPIIPKYQVILTCLKLLHPPLGPGSSFAA